MMGVESYRKNGRVFEGEHPYLLLCPQCNDVLECTNDNRGYCFGCGVVWKKSEVREMCKFIGNGDIEEYKEESE